MEWYAIQIHVQRYRADIMRRWALDDVWIKTAAASLARHLVHFINSSSSRRPRTLPATAECINSPLHLSWLPRQRRRSVHFRINYSLRLIALLLTSKLSAGRSTRLSPARNADIVDDIGRIHLRSLSQAAVVKTFTNLFAQYLFDTHVNHSTFNVYAKPIASKSLSYKISNLK